MLHVSKRLKAAEERMSMNKISDCSQMTNKILIRHKEKRKEKKKTETLFLKEKTATPPRADLLQESPGRKSGSPGRGWCFQVLMYSV